jgi:hypothetical protein
VGEYVTGSPSEPTDTAPFTYHRLSFLVKEGYFVELRESRGGKYWGRTLSVKTSGRMIANDRPWGSQDTTSVSVESFRIAMSLCGKASLFDVSADGDSLRTRLVLSSSSLSLTTERGLAEHGLRPDLDGDDDMRFARAVAASTR